MAKIDGNTLIARSLKQQGVDTMFGIVGFPVFGIAAAAQSEGITYVGMRNEQAASYAAAAAGYLTGRPSACLTVSGPGMIHGIAGLANAHENCWPMILIGGSSNSYQEGRGAFQEAPQVELARTYTKYSARPDAPNRIPFYVEQAVRTSIQGRPGAVYLDFPDDFISAQLEEEEVVFPDRCPDPPRAQADPSDVKRAIDALRTAERPLVIVGKGAAYSRAEDEVRAFIEATRLPFLSSPMGKGVVDDEHPLSVAPARGLALEQADLVVLLGARLNWIMHFGLPPRFDESVRTIQVDIHPEEIGRNVPAEVGLVGDLKAVVGQMNGALEQEPFRFPDDAPWREALGAKVTENKTFVQNMMNDDSVPMGYYRVLREIQEQAPPGTLIQAEGANTMDISRSVLMHDQPRHRLDAGTFGTMGVGLGQAIAAQVVHPDKKVICVEGDSAFGFSGMEIETACRYRLPIVFVIINNNGIGMGTEELPEDRFQTPAAFYTVQAGYEKMIEGFGGKGYLVRTPDELSASLKQALGDSMPSLINVLIDPHARAKPQKHPWLTQ
ncbi:MAG: oxalyl-CoA decarboxylase [Deltaproteobacteria bacterium]|jgi:2-hydroxyacyl-CoA lyase 1|nr:oxalyl-CoA decarboxylase [Deltaproteobacteria bacterium]MBW2501203.1 oxalyl-CoA decarboxylase [Deltaproteobacteria bacterium]